MPEILTPVKAMRAKCLDCMCGQATEVRLCPITDCSLYPYRMGHNPKRAGLGGKPPSRVSKSPSPPTQQTTYTADDNGKNS